MSGCAYISRLCAWAPGIENSSAWDEWAQGKRKFSVSAKGPEITFTDSLFRRRLSQISRMTVQVVHDILPVKEDTKMFFVSFRGELTRQYQINKMLIEDKALMPAAFSLSVFNAPAALASIALGLKGGYSALYPGNNSFTASLLAAQAEFLSGAQEELIFIYADEQAPPEYISLLKNCDVSETNQTDDKTQCPPPVAFAFLLTREPQSLSVPFQSLIAEEASPQGNLSDSPFDFLKRLLLYGKIHVSP
ncbi:hypothetical protein R84B8_01683 [Treponema sp. R8-4-B8]